MASTPLPRFEDHENQETKYTTCYMCACRCGIKVTVENEQVRFIQGNPDHPINKGVLCAKGNAGIMKQQSPAKLKSPLLRRPGTERGDGVFDEISWDDALNILTKRLKRIRETDPKKLAFFTGRDQMQALTGFWASQFGTINWAAHGGFCSVNMAAAGLYTMGHAFWEFGDPDWERTKYFMMWGVAEDHSSNPIKIGLKKIKENGAKFVSVNPVRTGYQAIADEWVAIKPGTDAMLALSMVHVLLEHQLIDHEFLIRYTNSAYLVVDTPGQQGDGLFLRGDAGEPLVWGLVKEQYVDGTQPDVSPALFGNYRAPDGRPVRTVMSMLVDKYQSKEYAPEAAAMICGVPAETIERLALEIAHVAFKETITIDVEWTDWAGRKQDKFIGRPVSMHAMRGISAHSNGFQTCRAIHLLQVLLGTIDCPGGHLAKPPFPKHIPPGIKPAKEVAPNTPLNSAPLGFPTEPEDLVIDDEGKPLRIDKAYSWDAPIANHGLMHMVISNAVKGDPYEIDTLMLFMANMAWNSSMNTANTMAMLREKRDDGEYKIPFIVNSDAFHSEMVNYSDLVLPDTTFLERFDTISMLDRPISEPDAACDSIRQPVIKPDRDVRAWQEVLVDLASRLDFPAFKDEAGNKKYKDYEDFIVNFERAPGIGFLAGWRGKNGDQHLRGEPNPNQWQAYIDNQCFFKYEFAPNQQFYRHANKDYLTLAKEAGWVGSTDQIVIELYSETLQKFRLAGQGLYDGTKPTAMPPDEQQRQRLKDYFDPLPFFYSPLEQQRIEASEYPFHAVTQRPMFMYHSWDSQNAWLRQIMSQNYLYMNRETCIKQGIDDESWVWVESHNGKIRAQVKYMEGVEANTVWTWNAIAKQRGAWGLDKNANEGKDAFLLNHLISELLPPKQSFADITNSDPITGQAAWYDLCVKITPCSEKRSGTWPEFDEVKCLPNQDASPDTLSYSTHENVNLIRALKDVFTRGK